MNIGSDTLLERLSSLHPQKIDLSLDRIKRLLERLGHPEHQLPPTIHVAGTNGKGSVIAYCRAILEAAGKAVHVYTSPHLIHFHERIRLAASSGGSAAVTETELMTALETCERVNDGAPITIFELITASAFLLYARHPADYLILEVGLGGRFDATNVIERPIVTAITPISYDHIAFLGSTLASIAAEKAGIIKPEIPCCVGKQDAEALETIRKQAGIMQANLAISGEDWRVFTRNDRLIYQDHHESLDLPLPRLSGDHQIDNSGMAITTIRLLKDKSILPEHIGQGLSNVDWPARLQRLDPNHPWDHISDKVELWLDGGHNPAAALVIAKAMASLDRENPRPLVLITGMIDSKDSAGFFSPFIDMDCRVITITIPNKDHSIPAGELARVARDLGLYATPADNLSSALAAAARTTPSPRILICGSLYMAGHVLAEQNRRMIGKR